MKLPVKGNTQRPTMEPGSYLGVLVQIIDLGTREKNYQGKTNLVRQVKLSFEFPEEKTVFNEEKGEQPFMISRDFTASMHEKATLRKQIEAWRGSKFTDEEASEYDVAKLLGKVALVNVSCYEKNGTKYNSLEAISPVPKQLKTELHPENKPIYFSLEEPDWKVYDAMPDWLKTKIAESPEYKALQQDDDELF